MWEIKEHEDSRVNLRKGLRLGISKSNQKNAKAKHNKRLKTDDGRSSPGDGPSHVALPRDGSVRPIGFRVPVYFHQKLPVVRLETELPD